MLKAYFLTQSLLPTIVDAGRIVNISSELARFFRRVTPLSGAIEVLSRYMAKELGPRSMAVNVVAGLLSDNRRWINSERIEVSGGIFL